MRIALSLAFLLALAAPARADVFVPAPAPARDADCVAAAGDVVVITRTLRAGVVVEASASGGPWVRVLGGPSREPGSCPVVAAAADGTAVIAGSADGAQHLAIRRPGGSFGAPVSLGRLAWSASVSAAPGGWVAAAWKLRRSERSAATTLTAAIFAPSGATRRTTLDRATGSARVAIGPGGSAIFAWSKGTHWLVARAAGVTAWGATSELPGGVGQRFTGGGIAVADGLVAWAADDGIRVQVDGEPPRTVSPLPDGAAVVAARAVDGTAAVAFVGAEDTIFAVDRGPGGDWSAPHQLTIPEQGETGDYSVDSGPAGIGLVAAPGGTVAAAWGVSEDAFRWRLIGATGQAGGAWTPATPVSAPTRDFAGFALSLDGAGAVRLLWAEPSAPERTGRLRAARVGTPPVPDTVAPVFSARVPSRLPATRTGRLRIDVPVSCVEACDVRLSIGTVDWIARELVPGRTTTVRLPVTADGLLVRTGQHRIQVTLEVSDSAGNVARQTSNVTVRVLARPLRSFKVGPRHDFAMFSAAGDRAVGRLVNAMIEELASGGTLRDLQRRYDDGIAVIERRFDEVHDSAVGDEIFDALSVPVTRAGYDIEDLQL